MPQLPYNNWSKLSAHPLKGAYTICRAWIQDPAGTYEQVKGEITQDVRKPDPHYQNIQRNNLRARYHADPDYLQDSVELSPQARSHR